MLILIIVVMDMLFLTFANNKSDKADYKHNILLDELYHKVDSLEQRIDRLESMMESDWLDSIESDNTGENVSDFNAERVLA